MDKTFSFDLFYVTYKYIDRTLNVKNLYLNYFCLDHIGDGSCILDIFRSEVLCGFGCSLYGKPRDSFYEPLALFQHYPKTYYWAQSKYGRPLHPWFIPWLNASLKQIQEYKYRPSILYHCQIEYQVADDLFRPGHDPFRLGALREIWNLRRVASAGKIESANKTNNQLRFIYSSELHQLCIFPYIALTVIMKDLTPFISYSSNTRINGPSPMAD
jgi:hypothetical protein